MIANAWWLFLDKILRMGVGLVINVQLTNYIGTAGNGLFNYAVMFVGMFYPLVTLGMDTIVVRELVNHPENKETILGTDLILRLCGGAFCFVVSPLLLWFLRPGEISLFYMVLLQLSTIFFLAFDVIELYYQSYIKSKYTVYARNTGFIISAVYKIVLLVQGATLPWFAAALTLETFLGVVLQYYFFAKQGHRVFTWKWDWTLGKKLLREGYPLMLSGFVVLIYMRIDVVMIGQIAGDAEAGIYAAAFRISEIWFFIPYAIINSVIPSLVRSFQTDKALYFRQYQRLYDLLIWFSIIMGIGLALGSHFIIALLYKPEFAAAANILIVHVWCGLFVAINTASSYHFTYEKQTRITLFKTGIGAATNVALNLLLIPKIGGIGAAWATIISYFIVALPSNYPFAAGRPMARLFVNSLNPFAAWQRIKTTS
jgi:PST family polysaccharide transporter